MDITIIFAGNTAGKFALDYVRPALTGSDKQIAWAAEIRAAREASVIKLLSDASKIKLPILLAIDGPGAAAPYLTVIRDKALGSTGPNGMTVSQLLDRVFAETSAKAWIDQRNDALHTIMRRHAA